MNKIYSGLLLLAACTSYGQTTYGNSATASAHGNWAVTSYLVNKNGTETCNAIVVNESDEQNGAFISGPQGQKAAVDIPIEANQTITISGLKVVLTSLAVPTFAHLRFYNGTMSEANEEDGTVAALIPDETLFDVTDTEIGEVVEIAYISNQNMYVREITLVLNTPIVLEGANVEGRYWMGVLSDANAWGTTANFETGEGVIGESLAMGSNNSDWFQLINLEGLYEMTAECTQSVSADCNVVVVNDTDEQNGTFISGTNGQKAAVDILIDEDQSMTISSLVVTLSSFDVPEFAHLRFYSSIYSEGNEAEGIPASFLPNEILFDVTDTEIGEVEEIAFVPSNNFYVRKITLNLNTPIVLNGAGADGRIWMGVLSDADAWSTTAHIDTGEGVVGSSLAYGSNTFDWEPLTNFECLYEITAECSVLAVEEISAPVSVLYPNPAKDTFTVSLPSQAVITSTEIYSVSGQKIKVIANNSATITISDLANGMYIIKTHAGNITYTNKLIKQ